MNFFIFLIILISGTICAVLICSKSNLSLKLRFKLDINSRGKVTLINLMILLLIFVIYSFSKNADNTSIKLFSIILLFILVFIYYIASDIKGMIIKEEADEKKKSKNKFDNEFCYFCGYKLRNNEKICPNCGKNIGDGS